MKYMNLLFLTMALANANDPLQALQQGNLEFSASLYQKIIEDTPGNIILSPLSVQTILALLQLGAKGDTALELTKGLSLPSSPEETKEAFKALLPKLKGNQFFSLDSANKIYLKQGYPIKPDFLKLSEEIFGAGLENINFDKNVEAANTINQWVEGKTNGKIKDLLDPSLIDMYTRLVLINAIYFKANWTTPFEKYATQKRKFFKSEKEEVMTDTMSLTETLNYVENKELDAQFIELPYEGGEVVFTIVLPNKKEGLSALEKRLGDVLKPQTYGKERINLYLPKFKIDSTFKLKDTLKKLGIIKAFDEGSADLSGILDNTEPLVVSQVIQKAFINVTEEGTEAAAATAVLVGLAASAYFPPAPPKIIEVNRPFFYTISHIPSKQTIFVGRISNV